MVQCLADLERAPVRLLAKAVAEERGEEPARLAVELVGELFDTLPAAQPLRLRELTLEAGYTHAACSTRKPAQEMQAASCSLRGGHTPGSLEGGINLVVNLAVGVASGRRVVEPREVYPLSRHAASKENGRHDGM
jgi:hypothetical protein